MRDSEKEFMEELAFEMISKKEAHRDRWWVEEKTQNRGNCVSKNNGGN